MLGIVVITVIMDWFMQNMRTRQPRLLQQKGWQEKEIFWWWRQNGSWMPMPTSKSNDNGHLVDFTPNIYVNRCSPMLPWLAGANMTAPSAGAGGNHCQNETWGQNLPPWSLFALTPPKKTYKTCTGMCTSPTGYLGGAGVRKLLRTTSARTSSMPSRNASGSSGHPHSWKQGQMPANIPGPDHHSEFAVANCCKTRFMWGDAGHGEGCPLAGPHSSSNAQGEDRVDEPLHQLAMLQQLPPLQ